MSSFYNDNEPYVVEWLWNLISADRISFGIVDNRTIAAVRPEDLDAYTRCHFFAGIGGWDYALQLAGWPESEPVWTGSCPCQPFSVAGKRKGTADDRHLWPEWRRLIEQCRPSTIFGEQVASKGGRQWLAGVFTDLEGLGYAVAGADLPTVCTPQIRQRLWWVALLGGTGLQGHMLQRERVRQSESVSSAVGGDGGLLTGISNYPTIESISHADGVSRPVGAVHAYGNAIVPQVAAAFIKAFMEVRSCS